MSADLWQAEITRDEQPVTTVEAATAVLRDLAVEYDHIEVEDAKYGIWLVGLVGVEGRQAARGDEVLVSDIRGRFYLPQP